MIIKNIGTKIVHIGTTVLMPDTTTTATKAVCEAPAIKAMVKKGLLSITEEPKAPKNSAKKGEEKKDDGKTANTDDGKTANTDEK